MLAEVDSFLEETRAAAVAVGLGQIGPDESFCFRIHKRGRHGFGQSTPELDREIGGAIWDALEQRYGKAPRVSLTNPDVMIVAEVLGERTAIGVIRGSWRRHPIGEERETCEAG